MIELGEGEVTRTEIFKGGDGVGERRETGRNAMHLEVRGEVEGRMVVGRERWKGWGEKGGKKKGELH